MAQAQLPYMNAYGSITKALEKIKVAAVPDRFTQDFLGTKLGLSGGSAKPLIPFLKRVGFLGSDGVPTERYKNFRNPGQAGGAAFVALKAGYGPLFEANEYAHNLSDDKLKGLVVSQTGLEADNSAVRAIVGSFKALKAFADSGSQEAELQAPPDTDDQTDKSDGQGIPPDVGKLAIGYTINLNLPATTEIAVFNAIFKSIRENLLPYLNQ
jgi:hypothetical protein